MPNAYRRLGIILDKLLLTAPVVRTVISETGMISGGSMTERDVKAIVETLNAGSLPRIIRLIDEKRVLEK